MKKIIIFLFLNLSINSFAQKVVKEKYYNGNTKYEYQVNSNGVKNGYYKAFENNGYLVESGFYKQGEKSGLWTTYDDYGKGQIHTAANYSNGKLNGENKVWCWEQVNGQIIRYLCGQYIFENGDEISSIKYNANNTISSKSVYNGKCFNNYPNGKTKEEWTRKDGATIAGTYKSYLENGKAETETINGKTYTYSTDKDCYGKLKEVEWDSLNYLITKKYDCAGTEETDIYDTIKNIVEKVIVYNTNDTAVYVCDKTQFELINCLPIYYRIVRKAEKEFVEKHLLNSKGEIVDVKNISKRERDILISERKTKWNVVIKNDKNIIIEQYIGTEFR